VTRNPAPRGALFLVQPFGRETGHRKVLSPATRGRAHEKTWRAARVNRGERFAACDQNPRPSRRLLRSLLRMRIFLWQPQALILRSREAASRRTRAPPSAATEKP